MSTILLYIMVFLTPVIYTNCVHELFEFPKQHFLYVFGSLYILCVLLENRGKKLYVKLTAQVVCAILFLLSYTVSTILSVSTYTSLWGYYLKSSGGLASTVIFVVMYLIISSNIYKREDVRKILYVAILGSIPCAIVSVLQHFGLTGEWSIDPTVRAFSTFGQPNWYAAYTVMVIPIALYYAVKSSNSLLKKLLFISAGINFVGFWYTYSLSGLLGLITSFIVLFTILFLNYRKNLKESRFYLLGGTILFSIFIFLNPGLYLDKAKDALTSMEGAPETAVSERILESSKDEYASKREYVLTDSGSIRTNIWLGSILIPSTSMKQFLVGFGPETFPYVFQEFRPRELNLTSEWNYTISKPHNYYIEVLVQNGIIGFVLYILLYVLLFFTPTKNNSLSVLAPLIGFAVTNIFGWPTITTSLLFWILLAYATKDNTNVKDNSNEKEGLNLTISLKLFCFAILMLSPITVFGFIRFTSAVSNKISENTLTYDSNLAEVYASYAILLNPNESANYLTRAKTYLAQSFEKGSRQKEGRNVSESENEEIITLKKNAEIDMLKAGTINPNDITISKSLLPLYYLIAVEDTIIDEETQQEIDIVDKSYAPSTQKYFQDIVHKYPLDVGVITDVAKYQKMLGFTKDYEESRNMIKDLRPDLLEWYLD